MKMGKRNWEKEEVLSRETAKAYSLLNGSFNVDVVLWETLKKQGLIDETGLSEIKSISDTEVQEYLEIRGLAIKEIQASSIDQQG
jgi:hypothetical protein